ncbi:hypothetical protein QFZ20_004061 [Flavobacterium sp. W4I14]|nr:hypothetical protein [Flavobacterium sp. W4I14]
MNRKIGKRNRNMYSDLMQKYKELSLYDKHTRQFIETAPISQEAKEKIGYQNAEKLLGL